MATGAAERYIPALRFRSLTRLYDPCVAATTREGAFKRRVLERAGLVSGERVLDLACGTGTLAIAATRQAPGMEVTGVDGDPEILEQARAKAESANTRISFDEALSTDLPYESGHFDVVLSTLFFHHLADDAKRRSAEEARRVIRSGGRLVLADFGRPKDPVMRAAFLWIQVFDGFDSTSANVAGRLPDILAGAGFEPVRVTDRFRALFGTIEVLIAGVP